MEALAIMVVDDDIHIYLRTRALFPPTLYIVGASYTCSENVVNPISTQEANANDLEISPNISRP